MFQDFSQLTFQVQQALIQRGAKLPAGHVQQFLCALLGYKSLASMQAASMVEDPGIPGAKHIICDMVLGEKRANELGYPVAVVTTMVAVLKLVAKGQAGVYSSEQQFLEDYVHPELQSGPALDDALSGSVAEMNCSGPSWVDVEFDEVEPIDANVADPWTLGISGVLTMEPDQERPFCGSKVKFEGSAEYPRAGRRLLTGNARVRARGEIADF